MTESLLDVRDLQVTFRRGRDRVRALRSVNLTVERGETVALVGESGSGKSTVARAVMRMCAIESGEIRFDGTPIQALRGKALRAQRQRSQMVFQDPYSSLDPSLTVERSVGEPLEVHTNASRREITERVDAMLTKLALPPDSGRRYPHEFSGGQRQRIAIARALVVEPELLILDEATSALDVPTQRQITRQLRRLQRELGLSYLFIAHDLDLVRDLADRVSVMYLGKIVESGPTATVFDNPRHPYTQALLAAIPVADPRIQRARRAVLVSGEPPDPAQPPSGCGFRTRCPHAVAECSNEPTIEMSGEHHVACIRPRSVAGAAAPAPISLAAGQPSMREQR